MATANSRIVTGLPELPRDLPDNLYSEFYRIYLAIDNLKRAIGEYSGVDSWPEDTWSQLSVLDTLQLSNLTKLYLPVTESVNFGSLVNIFDSSGTLSARKASASSASTLAHGIVTTLEPKVAGQRVEINLFQSITTGIAGMTTGSVYYLSTTPGSIINSPPTAVGTIRQALGVALGNSIFAMHINLQYIQN